jgi:poly(3-hydroxybutyrate) depolymerase
VLGPDSLLLTVLLIALSAGLLVAVIRWRLLVVRLLCGGLTIVVAMAGGVAVVNDYYGYYTTWGQMWADLHGTSGNLGVIAAASSAGPVSGRLSWVSLPGKLSGYTREGLVYLPPQYSEARYAHVRFPVVELFHGSPGSPLSWDTVLRVGLLADALMARHQIGPMVLVMPAINGGGRDYQDCVNGPGVNDETYVLKDVRADVLARYRVSSDPFEWGAGGYSSGGYCAANLALRHSGSFGAAAVIEGYYRASDGPAAAALGGRPALEAANSPLYAAERLTPGGGPVPAFWVAAGTHDSDYKPATVFTSAMDRIEEVPFVRVNTGDRGGAWQAVLPGALTWMWQQLAPPDLRVLFPVASYTVHPFTSLRIRPAKPHGYPEPKKQRNVTAEKAPAKVTPSRSAVKPALD